MYRCQLNIHQYVMLFCGMMDDHPALGGDLKDVLETLAVASRQEVMDAIDEWDRAGQEADEAIGEPLPDFDPESQSLASLAKAEI